MKLLAISSPEFIPDEARIINGLFREGLEYMHIRKPGSSVAQLKILLSGIEKAFANRIAIHQHHELALEFEITRLHLTESERKTKDLYTLENLKKRGFFLSTSVHNLKEMKTLNNHFSYTFFGPVFDSISKEGYKSALNKDFFLEEKHKSIPAMALGGIDISNIQQVRKMNFDGAAILGALWQNPLKAVEVFQSLNTIVGHHIQSFAGGVAEK